ncbi:MULTISPECIES: hypothetical protein [unclassified Oceanobacillus]|uniref:hypothetical protein n=1 Tax=unclassified Oceanobacillus TaxID=2630292 RepID=UPI001BE955F5|nr:MULTISPECIES: hypothetical protein [unclassified Oceanobacillus]MBT2599101.1 hypothetical protein [Oceanobacillus sp. ISL-74]MBT2652019.1 hypothetical protein [Oceanobacillus sp. ISL-73]
MAETVSVNPSPIQRNTNDVAIELTKLYGSRFGFASEEELENTYARYYALAKTLELNYRGLDNLVPEDILNKIIK